MTLKPQDILILLKMVAQGGAPWSYNQLAFELGMSASETHAGIRRAAHAGLMQVRSGWGSPDLEALSEFLLYGVRYAFAPDRGGLVQGVPTAFWASPLKERLPATDEPPCVWPDEGGPVKGLEFSPLYRSAPLAARRDAGLYQLLVLVDALRIPHPRRELAVAALRDRLQQVPQSEAVAAPTRAALAKRGSHGKESHIHRR